MLQSLYQIILISSLIESMNVDLPQELVTAKSGSLLDIILHKFSIQKGTYITFDDLVILKKINFSLIIK